MSIEAVQRDLEFDLFVSYAHVDDGDGWVSALVEAIKREHAGFTPAPLRVFFDRQAIRDMHDWEMRILKGLRESAIMLAVVSPSYFQSHYCRREWQVYLEHELARALLSEGMANIYFIAVPDLEESRTGELDDWKRSIKQRQFCDVRPWHSDGVEALQRDDVRQRLRALEQEIHVRLEQARRAAGSPTTIPPHNLHFVGRQEELRQLRATLLAGAVGAITAVQGIGGIGKSALAFEYAHAYADSYPGGRYLIPCEGIDDIRKALFALAPDLELRLWDSENLDAAAAQIRTELIKRGPSLLLLDNVDCPQLLAPNQVDRHLPDRRQIQVLVTTRMAPDQILGAQSLALAELTTSAGVRLLEKYRPNLNQRGDEPAATAIVDYLGGHALACEIVAVYLWQHPEISCISYLEHLKQSSIAALDDATRDDTIQLSRHPEKGLCPLLAPTFDSLRDTERLMLGYAALLPSDGIVLPWLRELVGEMHAEIIRETGPGLSDPWLTTVRKVLGLRLIVPTQDSRLVRMHRIVQMVILAIADDEQVHRLEAILEYLRRRVYEGFDITGWLDPSNRWETAPALGFVDVLMKHKRTAHLQKRLASMLFRLPVASEVEHRNYRQYGRGDPEFQNFIQVFHEVQGALARFPQWWERIAPRCLSNYLEIKCRRCGCEIILEPVLGEYPPGDCPSCSFDGFQ